MQSKSDKTQKLRSIINYSCDKEGGNETSFSASIRTPERLCLTSANIHETAEAFSLLSAMHYLCLLESGQLLSIV